MRNSVRTPANNILSFLIRSWADDRKARLFTIPHQGGYADTEKRYVHLMDYYDPKILPEAKGVARWRLWRFVCFHEAGHLKFTPKGSKTDIVRDLEYSLPNLSEFTTDTLGFAEFLNKVGGKRMLLTKLYEVVEDAYVNHMMVADWKGMQDEYFATRESGINNLETNFIPMMFPNSPEQFITILALWTLAEKREAFYTLKPELQTLLRKAATMVDTVGSNRELTIIQLFDLFAKNFRLFEFPPPEPAGGGGGGSKDGSNPSSNKAPPLAGLDKAKTEFEEIVKLELSKEEVQKLEESVSSEVAEEFEELEANEKAEHEQEINEQDFLTEFSAVKTSTFPSSDEWEKLVSQDKATEQRLLTRLSKWKVGWREVLGTEGGEIDGEEYLADRFSCDPRERAGKFYYDENKTSPRGSLDILWDISGSTSSDLEIYQRAILMIGNVLDKLHSQFAIYGFNDMVDTNLWLFKEARNRWSDVEKGRIAGASSNGGTPLGEVLKELGRVMLKANRKKLVVFTDGQPQNRQTVIDNIAALEHRGMTVYIVGIGDEVCKNYRQAFYDMKGGRNPSQVAFVNMIEDLPDAFFNLVAPRG